MNSTLTIIWFEQDLRLSDNPALNAALNHKNVLPIYIFDYKNARNYHIGKASQWWLHHSLKELNKSLNNQLNIYYGDAKIIISDLCSRFNVKHIFWNRRYEPWRIARDKLIKSLLLSQAIKAQSFNGSLLNEPWSLLKNDNTPYKVFTPYHRQAEKCEILPDSLPYPTLPLSFQIDSHAVTLETLSLLPSVSWDKDFYTHWQPGEENAQTKLHHFLQNGLEHYKEGRDFPASKFISALSPHLHFGEIAPHTIVNILHTINYDDNREHFKRELRWREFSYYLLFHWPTMPHTNLKPNLANFPWQSDKKALIRWQKGLTGYPFVDAGMRELWQTGFMHNRVRMITASFLVKNLLIDWRLGAQWFWDCLLDADLASNSASWQWVAGCGTDASPFFRIFNPITQGEKFDPEGKYTKRYLPELKDLPIKYLYRPWEAPPEILKKANITLGKTYPLPIIDIKISRKRALDTYKMAKI